MKINIFKIGASLLFMILIGGSCSESFLDTEPRGVLTTENFYNTDEEAVQGVIAAYAVLQNINSRAFVSNWALKVLPGDEVTAGGGSRGDQIQLEELNEFNYGPNNSVVSFVFSRLYHGINRCNMVLTYVKDDSPVKKAVLAEAKFMRALFYFDLVTLFGEVPLVLKELSVNEYQQLPVSEQEIWTQIEKDLIDAVAGLPKKSVYSAKDKYRAPKGAAQALLGKAYLYQGKYADAAAQFHDVIISGEYDLAPDYDRVLRKDLEFGIESLFEVSYTTSKGYTWGNYKWDSKYTDDNVFWQFCGPRENFFNKLEAIGMWAGWGGCYPTDAMYQAYVSENDKTRRTASIISEAEFTAAGASRVPGEIYGYRGYLRLKYGTIIDESDGPTIQLNVGTNLRLIRYADVLLMAAEAEVLKSTPAYGTARGYINQVRDRVGLSEAPEADGQLMSRIMKERRLELSFEGHRYPDLIRWNNAGIITDSQLKETLNSVRSEIPGRKSFDAKFKKYPIPEQEIVTNPNMEQNTGY